MDKNSAGRADARVTAKAQLFLADWNDEAARAGARSGAKTIANERRSEHIFARDH